MYCKNERIAHFLFFGEQCEWITQVTHQKWAMWANRSGRSPKMSDHEPFAQVAQRKWVIVSESLRLLTKNEGMSESLICSFLGQQASDLLGNLLSEFPALLPWDAHCKVFWEIWCSWLCGVIHTTELDSAKGCTLRSLTPPWDAHRGAWLAVWCTPQSFLKSWISKPN